VPMINKTEDYHHSRDQIVNYVRHALEIADELCLSDADRKTLLPSIYGTLQSKQVFYEQVQMSPAMHIPRNAGH